MIEIDLVRFISILEVQATAEAPTEEVTEEIVAEDNGRASSRNFEDFEVEVQERFEAGVWSVFCY